MTHYIVSGHRRTGTSMMMRCLMLGGMEVEYDKIRKPSEKINKYGNFELSSAALATNNTINQYPNKLIKAHYDRLRGFKEDKEYNIVFMIRDAASVLNSFDAAFDGKPMGGYDPYTTISKLKVLPQVNVTLVKYECVLAHPLETFEYIRLNGFPIDAPKAAQGVEVGLKRF